jgi:hypothetical protein
VIEKRIFILHCNEKKETMRVLGLKTQKPKTLKPSNAKNGASKTSKVGPIWVKENKN